MNDQPQNLQTGTAADPQKVIQAVYMYAAEMMKMGMSNIEIENALVKKGLERQAAIQVIGNLSKLRSDAFRKAAMRNMVIGAIICVVGIVITIGTFSMASSSPSGGRYVIAWGAIIFGGIRFFQGMMQLR